MEDTLARGLAGPTAFAPLPDGRILIAEKWGLVRVLKAGALLPTPFIDLRPMVNDYADRGLIGMTIDPDFARTGYVYLLYVYENDATRYAGTKTARLTRVTAQGDVAQPSSAVAILGTVVGATCKGLARNTDCLPADARTHSVGSVRVAPDGALFVTLGDASDDTTVNTDALRAQDLDSPAGKILRVASDGRGLPDNPFWDGDPNSIRSKVWARGVHNAFRFALSPGGGVGSGRPYAGDVGWNDWEEIDVAPPGANLGWPCYEGAGRQPAYAGLAACQSLYADGPAAVTPPLIAINHNGGGAAVAAGTFLPTGTPYPAGYAGSFFYADYVLGFIRRVRVDGADAITQGPVDFATGAGAVVDLEVGPAGDLYYLDIFAGELRHIRYSPPGAEPSECPQGSWLARYYASRDLTGQPAVVRCEAAPISYDWGPGTPVAAIGTDNFSIGWTGRHLFDAGRYTFHARAYDGVRILVDGVLSVDNWPPRRLRRGARPTAPSS